MLIDWFTVGAQALNFLILIWLLKRFLYQPILHAIDAREKSVAAELADADAKRAEAKKDRDAFEKKNADFDAQRAALLSEATDAANAQRKKLLKEAGEAADALAAKRAEGLRQEAQRLGETLRRRTQEEVFALARKALADLSGVALEAQMVAAFICRLRAMDGQPKAQMAEALKSNAEPVLVYSAFGLGDDQKAAIQQALNETFSADIPIRYEEAPALIGGIELSAKGQKIAWSIADYLGALEKDVAGMLAEKKTPEAPVAPAKETAKPTEAPKPEVKKP